MFISNINASIGFSLTALRLVGFWSPENMMGKQRILYNCYGFMWFMFLLGNNIILQFVEMYCVWGNLPLMTAVSYILFTNLVHTLKIATILYYGEMIRSVIHEGDEEMRGADSEEGKIIVQRCNRETALHVIIYCCVSAATLVCWTNSAEKGQLPLRVWYPYDVGKSPAYQITYVYQMVALSICALLNISKDTLVTSLMAQCCCRLQLLGLSLRTVCRGIPITEHLLTANEEVTVKDRLRQCVMQHNSTLEAVKKIQKCFSFSTFMQFNVSLLIICVTAFQLVSVTGNQSHKLATGGYLIDMTLQVFLYCYQGSRISQESADIADAAYHCPWYVLSNPLRRNLLIIMMRTRIVAKFVAAGITTVSFSCFTTIIKTSYSMFTLLQQLENGD